MLLSCPDTDLVPPFFVAFTHAQGFPSVFMVFANYVVSGGVITLLRSRHSDLKYDRCTRIC